MVSGPLLAMSSVTALHMNFSFCNIVLYMFPSSILIIAKPDISSINGALTLINFCSLALTQYVPFEKWVKTYSRSQNNNLMNL